jgi:REP element-mobilizing transposase RayT
MSQQPYVLDAPRGKIVVDAIQEICSSREYTLWAAHARTAHVHVVVTASCEPETVMHALKAYSSRTLNHSGLDEVGRLRWARHGSTRYLWTPDALCAAIRYVVHEQGEPMAVFERPQNRDY